LISRIPITDISPAVYFGGEFVAVKAIAKESISVAATIIIEGHETLTAEVCLYNAKEKMVDCQPLVQRWPGTDRYEGQFTVPAEGDFYFVIKASSTSMYRTVTGESEKYPVRADRDRALVGSWYEFFPRSEGAVRNADGTVVSGTFATATKRLPGVAAMGFDVLYLPPVHPIGVAHRKGKNNTLDAKADDCGVPWAIGNSDGGHDAINPALGTMKDFEDFVKAAGKQGLEVAMDLALQTSPDHPWVKSNPEWFNKRADGTIAYAENPPKKYQDIYPINFDDDYEGIRNEVLRVIRLWVSKGVKIFRVDNPHTKPVHFWQDLLAIVYKRTSKWELTEYGREVAQGTSAFFRPNFWVNTPDINPFHLQSGNPAIFALRAVLASTLTPSWGMYAGYELYEHRAFKEGGEEYMDSEKYEIKVRDWEGAGKKGLTLAPFIAQLNAIRKAHPALQRLRNLTFHDTDSDAIIAYSKREGKDLVLVVVNLDPSFAQGTTVHWNMEALGFSSNEFEVKDLLDGSTMTWSPHTYVSLNPTRPVGKVAHIVSVKI